MSEPVLKALVVDDDPITRKVVAFALRNEGFQCDLAGDGVEALKRIETAEYDLVVTDLCMPNTNGHTFSVELLRHNPTPVLVIHTCVDDPRVTKDLMSRGVDDIVFKPTNYAAFAAKTKVLVERRRKAKSEAVATVSGDPRNNSPDPETRGATDHLRHGDRISTAEFESRLSTVWHILPLSQAAVTLLDEVRKDDASTSSIAGVIQRDAAITADVLRLVNSGFYKASSREIVDIEEAVTRIGMRRVGELAVAMSAMGALSKSVVPWLNKELAAERSLAGGIAVSRLLDATCHKALEDGMVLAAVMYPLGRVVLGTLFPSLYEQMLATSRKSLVALRQLEHDVFPEPHSAATARVLAHWGLPKEIYGPLAYTAQSFDSLSSLRGPGQSNVFLVKTGILLGQLAVGQWLPEDLIDFPSVSKLSKLGIDSCEKLLDQIRGDLNIVATNSPAPDTHQKRMSPPTATKDASRKLRYCNLSPEPVDFLRLLLTSMGFELEDVPCATREFGDPLVVNCTHAPAARLAARRSPTESCPWVIVVDNELPAAFQKWGEIIRLPASYGALWAACDKIAGSASRADPKLPGWPLSGSGRHG